VMLAIERAREADAATALNDCQHFAVGKAADELQSLVRWIDSEREDRRVTGFDEPITLPSEVEYFWIDEAVRNRLGSARVLVVEALVSLRDQQYVGNLTRDRGR
jgi:hypothetical protein